uniref:(northern house mosquito) hypothetical protein n=1 Tax=Culex pipiens TaxID=7175 RepID=A0A8D8E1T5_CULPI
MANIHNQVRCLPRYGASCTSGINFAAISYTWWRPTPMIRKMILARSSRTNRLRKNRPTIRKPQTRKRSRTAVGASCVTFSCRFRLRITCGSCIQVVASTPKGRVTTQLACTARDGPVTAATVARACPAGISCVKSVDKNMSTQLKCRTMSTLTVRIKQVEKGKVVPTFC